MARCFFHGITWDWQANKKKSKAILVHISATSSHQIKRIKHLSETWLSSVSITPLLLLRNIRICCYLHYLQCRCVLCLLVLGGICAYVELSQLQVFHHSTRKSTVRLFIVPKQIFFRWSKRCTSQLWIWISVVQSGPHDKPLWTQRW